MSITISFKKRGYSKAQQLSKYYSLLITITYLSSTNLTSTIVRVTWMTSNFCDAVEELKQVILKLHQMSDYLDLNKSKFRIIENRTSHLSTSFEGIPIVSNFKTLGCRPQAEPS
jgi:hypothetical protein